MSSLKDLLAQKEALQAQIDQVLSKERNAAIESARELIQEFDLTADDLFGRTKKSNSDGKRVVEPKYRDPETGATWTGRGKAPKWIEGKVREQFVIK